MLRFKSPDRLRDFSRPTTLSIMSLTSNAIFHRDQRTECSAPKRRRYGARPRPQRDLNQLNSLFGRPKIPERDNILARLSTVILQRSVPWAENRTPSKATPSISSAARMRSRDASAPIAATRLTSPFVSPRTSSGRANSLVQNRVPLCINPVRRLRGNVARLAIRRVISGCRLQGIGGVEP